MNEPVKYFTSYSIRNNP